MKCLLDLINIFFFRRRGRANLPIEALIDDPASNRFVNERPSQAACRHYNEIRPVALANRILDGTSVAPGEYPHMGGLVYSSDGGKINVRCGSSLISERYAITAAHCASDPLQQPSFVRFGVVAWNSTNAKIPTVDIEIEKIITHPEYVSHLRYHDLAILRLREEVKFTPYISPACLNSDINDVDPSIPLIVIGWGVTDVQSRAVSSVLLMTNLTTVPLQECNATHLDFGVSRSYKNGLGPGHYCAHDYDLRKSACQSDSGGPLQLVKDNEIRIVGMVSFGLSCASDIPAVYSRVAYYLDWIESVVWPPKLDKKSLP